MGATEKICDGSIAESFLRSICYHVSYFMHPSSSEHFFIFYTKTSLMQSLRLVLSPLSSWNFLHVLTAKKMSLSLTELP